MKTEKKDINIQIGKRLRTARQNSGYTQEAFAEALDVGVEHYRKLESGIYGLQPEKLLLLYEKYIFGKKKKNNEFEGTVTVQLYQTPKGSS